MEQHFLNDSGLVVSLFYKHDDLFTKMQKESSIRLRNLVDNADKLAFLKFISEDRAWYDENIAVSTDKIYDYFQAYGKQFTQSYQQIAELYDDDEVSIGMHVVYNLNLGANYDVNTVLILDDKTQRAIIAHALSFWFQTKNDNTLSALFKSEADGYMDEVRYLLQQRVKGIRRNVGWL